MQSISQNITNFDIITEVSLSDHKWCSYQSYAPAMLSFNNTVLHCLTLPQLYLGPAISSASQFHHKLPFLYRIYDAIFPRCILSKNDVTTFLHNSQYLLEELYELSVPEQNVNYRRSALPLCRAVPVQAYTVQSLWIICDLLISDKSSDKLIPSYTTYQVKELDALQQIRQVLYLQVDVISHILVNF